MLRTSRTIALLLIGASALAACSPKPPKVLPPEPGPQAAPTRSTTVAQPTVQGPVPGSQVDFAATLMGRDTIYFDTDKYNVDSADAAALQVQAQWLMKYPSKRATIEGHCDLRGTNQYNLILGKKRSKATFDYFVKLGIDPARLTVTTVGEEQPFETGNSEKAYASNRRSHFIITKR